MRLKLTIPALLASSFIMAQQADSPVSLSLDDCLRVALSDNPTVRVADMEISRTDYSKIETISQLLPQVSFAGTYSRTLAKQVMYMNMDGFGGMGGDGEDAGDSPTSRASGGGGGIKVGLDNSYQVGFSASLPLIAPQLWASLKLSDNQILQAVEKSTRIETRTGKSSKERLLHAPACRRFQKGDSGKLRYGRSHT